MKVALAVNEVVGNSAADLACIEALALQAGQARAELVVFPEAAPTGLINDDSPAHDLPLGTPIPGPTTEWFSRLAARAGLWLATGLLEREEDHLFDSAVLLDPAGRIALHYRRMQPQWHGSKADPTVYRQGERVVAVETPMGRIAALICGDLFDDPIVAQVRELAPDYLLYPFARNFGDGTWDQDRWDREELPEYAARARMAGCTTLMTNLLLSHDASEYACFGGAWVVSAGGEVLHRKPLGERGILLAEV